MVQVCENLPLYSKPAQHFVGVCAAFEYFDRDTFLKLSVGTFGEIDGPHSAASEFFDNYVRPYPLSNASFFILCETSCSKFRKLLKYAGILAKQFFSLTEEC